jgi:hypothetical protein
MCWKDARGCWIPLQNDMGKKAIVVGASSAPSSKKKI